jgi:hypothetical protein
VQLFAKRMCRQTADMHSHKHKQIDTKRVWIRMKIGGGGGGGGGGAAQVGPAGGFRAWGAAPPPPPPHRLDVRSCQLHVARTLGVAADS